MAKVKLVESVAELGVDPEMLLRIARTRLQAWEVARKRIDNRRLHFFNEEAVDPSFSVVKNADGSTTDPFANIARIQSDRLRFISNETVARVIENPIELASSPPRDEVQLRREADKQGTIWNTWLDMEQADAGIRVQEAMARSQVNWGMCFLHSPRRDFARAPLPHNELDELPDGKERGNYGLSLPSFGDNEHDCPECEGEGQVRGDDPYASMGECEDCGGAGRIVPNGKKKYRETTAAWEERMEGEWVEQGSPWGLEVCDVFTTVPIFDRNAPGGLGGIIRRFEVARDEYEWAAAKSTSKRATNISDVGIAPGLQNPGADGVSFSTPSEFRGEAGPRIRVWQIWTEEVFLEWVMDGADSDAHELKKAFRHGYGEVPFWPVWGIRTYDADPAWMFESYLEGIYRLKPFFDHVLTLNAALISKNVEAPFMAQADPNMAPMLSEDGLSGDMDEDTEAGREAPAGMTYQQIKYDVPAGLAPLVRMFWEMIKEAEPSTGNAPVGATTQPWTALISQTQANVGPKLLVRNQVTALEAMYRFRSKWHARHPEERLVSYDMDSKGHVHAGNVISAEAKGIDKYRIHVTIDSVSSPERISLQQHMAQLFQMGLVTEEDFQREARHVRNPLEYIDAKLVAQTAIPYRTNYVAARFAKVLGSQFLVGPNGQPLTMSGDATTPEAALAAHGDSIPGGNPAAMPPGSGTIGNSGGMGQMPGLQDLNLPNGQKREGIG